MDEVSGLSPGRESGEGSEVCVCVWGGRRWGGSISLPGKVVNSKGGGVFPSWWEATESVQRDGHKGQGFSDLRSRTWHPVEPPQCLQNKWTGKERKSD